MSWYKESKTKVWGTMASGILFINNNEFFLDCRSKNVQHADKWGVPGGALTGTEKFYNSHELSYQEITDQLVKDLWISALREVSEELQCEDLCSILNLSENDYNKYKKSIYRDGGFIYITFIVDLNEDQKQELIKLKPSKESLKMEWKTKEETEDLTKMPGLEKAIQEFDIDIDKVTICNHEIKTAEDRWTQGQVYISEGKVYDVEKILKETKDNQTVEINIKKLSSQLYDRDAWKDNDRNLSPMMVLINPTYDHEYIKHMTIIRKSDLDNPILVRSSNGKIIDGYHRLAKAFLINKEFIKVKYIQEETMAKALIQESVKTASIDKPSIYFYVDMDNTLLYTLCDVARLTKKTTEEKLMIKNGEWEKVLINRGYKLVLDSGSDKYYSKLRPGANEFLSSLSSMGKTFLCTYGTSDYAGSAMQILGIDSYFTAKYYRDNIDNEQMEKCDRFILIDDLPFRSIGVYKKMKFLGYNDDGKEESYEKECIGNYIDVKPYFGEDSDSDLSVALIKIQNVLNG